MLLIFKYSKFIKDVNYYQTNKIIILKSPELIVAIVTYYM
jgi:hypothetical protein